MNLRGDSAASSMRKAGNTVQHSAFPFYLKGDIAQIHDADAHVLQHGELLSCRRTQCRLEARPALRDHKKLRSECVRTVGAEQGLELSEQADGVKLSQESVVTETVPQLDNEATDESGEL